MSSMDGAAVAAVWPNSTVRSGVTAGYLVAVSLTAALLSKRVTSFQALRASSPVKLLVVFLLVDSWLFVFASAILLLGVGSSLNLTACALGIWWCIFLYASSKIFIYLFLMERVFIVHATTSKRSSRWSSPWYRVSMLFFLAWIGVFIVMIVGRIALIRQDRACIIGLKLWATIPMLAVDLLVNVFLTTAFVYPIWRSKFGRARALARNSSLAAVAALITSFANITVLSVQKGHQLSWVCLGSCGLDVTINAAIIYYVTRTGKEDDLSMTTTPTTQKRPTTGPTAGILSHRSHTPAMQATSGIFVVSEIVTQTDFNDDPEYKSPRGPTGLRRNAARPSPLSNISDSSSTAVDSDGSPGPQPSITFHLDQRDVIAEEDANEQASDIDEKDSKGSLGP